MPSSDADTPNPVASPASTPAAASRLRSHAATLPDAGERLPVSLAGVVVLAGSVRANHLRRSTGRGPLEMPVSTSRSVMQVWERELSDLVAAQRSRAEAAGARATGWAARGEPMPVRVMVDEAGPEVSGGRGGTELDLRIERDPSALRGTGGLLHDLARAYQDTDRLLVVHGSQLPMRPLAEALAEVDHPGADVNILSDRSGSPAGVMVVRCGALRAISPVGFVDLNEQALPKIASDHDVRVTRLRRPLTRSIRTLSGYLETLRILNRRDSGRLVSDDPFAEDWQASFYIAEGGANVDPTAIIHDSVILAGARVDAGAVVVRSVVCPGATVRRQQSIVDRILGA